MSFIIFISAPSLLKVICRPCLLKLMTYRHKVEKYEWMLYVLKIHITFNEFCWFFFSMASSFTGAQAYNHKLCLPIIHKSFFTSSFRKTKVFLSSTEVWLQSWNLKELTEWHHQKSNLLLNLIQRRNPPMLKTHPARTLIAKPRDSVLDSVSCACPPIVGKAICL